VPKTLKTESHSIPVSSMAIDGPLMMKLEQDDWVKWKCSKKIPLRCQPIHNKSHTEYMRLCTNIIVEYK